MWQPISRQMHGVAEAAYIPAMASAPESVGFTRQETATTLCRAIGGMALVSALVTKAEWGAVPVVPYKAHLAVDVVTSLFTLAAPWLFGFSHHQKARNTFIALGVTGLVVGALSRPEEMDPLKERTLRRKAEALPAL
ncbi:SPW repeat domain-containing protein [Nibribacter koreensis]|uniref:SPW repeat-containing integral membrane domain-containing protein n=1 Tax=Nibribacter koreensis TaxID=1084519 RepID=A0ABP8F542_9BACT